MITGHIFQDKLADNLAKYLIYSFHMPLFIGISGYLIRYHRLNDYSPGQLLQKYLNRVIIPWFIAVFVYMLVTRWHEIYSVGSFITLWLASLAKPYYHLWFITAFLSFVFISWICARLKLRKSQFTFFAIVYTLFFVFLKEYAWMLEAYPRCEKTVEVFLHTFRPYYFIYFVFGMLIRGGFRKIVPLRENIFLIAIGFLALVVLFYYPDRLLEIPLSYVLNICLIYLVISTSKKNLLPKSRLIEWIGINSLGIYLWHVLVIIAIKRLIDPQDILMFYTIIVLSQIAFLLLYRLTSRFKAIKLYFFGIVK